MIVANGNLKPIEKQAHNDDCVVGYGHSGANFFLFRCKTLSSMFNSQMKMKRCDVCINFVYFSFDVYS